MLEIAGVSTNPLGDPIQTSLRFVCTDGEGAILTTAPVTIETDTDGVYSFNLVRGKFTLEVLNQDQWNLLANLDINVDSGGPIDLNTLIDTYGVIE